MLLLFLRKINFILALFYKIIIISYKVIFTSHKVYLGTNQMLYKICRTLFPSRNQRVLSSYDKVVKKIRSIGDEIKDLSDEEIKLSILNHKERISQLSATLQEEALNEILHDVFAKVIEASKRTLAMAHYDVQILGGIALHQGKIAEMKTGEGKTLASTLPIALNALTGNGVHVITVNDYLAMRDANWNRPIFEFLGLTVGHIEANMDPNDRLLAYQQDITYGTNNEFAFDYLRDNLQMEKEGVVQKRGLRYAVIDELDSVLIDEGRTPLIISGPADDNTALYSKIDTIIQLLSKEDYEIDEKTRRVTLTDAGMMHIDKIMRNRGIIKSGTLYDAENVHIFHNVEQALAAHNIMKKDSDYIVKDKQIMIIDDFTGRIMMGHRYGGGLHQAIEAKEGVPIQNENRTIASITYQNYFRLYKKISGMTGTAHTEAREFEDIYNLSVLQIPTHKSNIRIDQDDIVLQTNEEKYKAILEHVHEVHEKGNPILLGTISIDQSEKLSRLLKNAKIKHQVLNAKHHAKEAHIIAQAGRWKAVTIATNMAGRGTDIQLGGNVEFLLEEQLADKAHDSKEIAKLRKIIQQQVEQEKQKVIDVGGLCIIGTERHESRRIDDQLRGRAGRQGDPGTSLFFISLQDDIIRAFGSTNLSAIMNTLGVEKDEHIVHPWITKAIEKAQKKIESDNYERRKTLLKFDDILNVQRRTIYKERNKILDSSNVYSVLDNCIGSANEILLEKHINLEEHSGYNIKALHHELSMVYHNEKFLTIDALQDAADLNREHLLKSINVSTNILFKDKMTDIDTIPKKHSNAQHVFKMILLMTLDQAWQMHLQNLDSLKQSVFLRAYGQKDPLNEYKREAFNLFEKMLDHIIVLSVARIMNSSIRIDNAELKRHNEIHDKESSHNKETHQWSKTPRNALCPCNSGKKYKQCHGIIQ